MTTTQEPLLAWHGNAKLQKEAVATMAAHRKADTLVKGRYWEGGKGCAVGCLIHSGDHIQYELRFGIPIALARLEDTIFEHLPNGTAMKWPERFLKAAKPGADLSLVQWKFLAFVVDEALSRKGAASVREACLPALEIVRARARGEDISESAARSARSAAESAAWSAESAAWSARSVRSAWSAAESAAWSAARSAAESAWSAARSAAESAAWSVRSVRSAWSARSAAESAARSSAWSARSAAESVRSVRSAWSAAAARSAAESVRAESAARSAWKRYADKLIELMAEAA